MASGGAYASGAYNSNAYASWQAPPGQGQGQGFQPYSTAYGQPPPPQQQQPPPPQQQQPQQQPQQQQQQHYATYNSGGYAAAPAAYGTQGAWSQQAPPAYASVVSGQVTFQQPAQQQQPPPMQQAQPMLQQQPAMQQALMLQQAPPLQQPAQQQPQPYGRPVSARPLQTQPSYTFHQSPTGSLGRPQSLTDPPTPSSWNSQAQQQTHAYQQPQQQQPQQQQQSPSQPQPPQQPLHAQPTEQKAASDGPKVGQPLRLLPQSKWMRDEDARFCCHCNTVFSVLNRRHHCRACGKVFDARVELVGSNTQQRICVKCHELHAKNNA